MREMIIKFLKSNSDDFVSGESIANKLGISRAAVWKHIQQLRKSGYNILSRENCGYKLESTPDILLPNEIQTGLNTKIIGKNIIHYDSIDSTSRAAKEMARSGAADGTVIVAEVQSDGKGRLGRSYFAPKYKNILFSVILRPKFLPNEAPKCTLMAAVAVANAMIKFNLQPGIKWPNDIMFDNRKVVGILTELSAEMSKINYIVVGTGINVNVRRSEFPAELQNIAASLYEMNDNNNISRLDFFKTVLEEFDKIYIDVNNNGFDNMFDQWRKYNITLGKHIRVIPAGSNDEFAAIAEDIDADGALIVKTSTGLEKVYAGDVSIRETKI
ncbi:MAG: biotin--[Selenomonadaceae bacterium]|nr:biotin--[acetyl-CoA-carboxylase] ligase [Selenomonadaceae bacterium]